jgi:hypothetical protein
VMEGKLDWYQSVVEVDLTGCEEDAGSGVLAELGSMPSLRSLMLPASYAESAVDVEAVCGLTTLTTLRFDEMRLKYNEDGELVEVGEWVLDLSRPRSRLPTLAALQLDSYAAVTDKEVQALSNVTALASLNLCYCINVTSEGLRAVIK